MDDRRGKLEKGLYLIREARWADFKSYLAKLRDQEPLLSSLLEVARLIYTNSHSQAIRKGARLLVGVSDKPQIATYLFEWLGMAHSFMGEMETAANYFLKQAETAEAIGDQTRAARAKMNLLHIRFMKAEYESAYREIKDYARGIPLADNYVPSFLIATIEIVKGRPKRAVEILESLMETVRIDKIRNAGIKEILGLAYRMMGEYGKAYESYMESTNDYLEVGSAYAAFPLAKAMELSRLAGMDFPPRKLIRKCLTLARKGSWGEQAAAQEIEALLRKDESEILEGVFEAAQGYYRAHQPIEAALAGLAAAYLAWQAESQVFPKALRFLAPLVPLHPGLKLDPILGGFLNIVEPLLEDGIRKETDRGIRAHLIDGLRVFVDGKEIHPARCGNRKAVKALVYLLLSPKHRVPGDHLFYLLWPRRKFNDRSRFLLYTAVNTIRRILGERDYLTKKHDFYQLEDTWTDLGEIENLVRLADAARDPVEKEEFLARARELARGELLPEFPYDRHIDEYRQYYERLRKRIFEK